VAHKEQPPHAWDTCWYPGLLGGWHVAFESLEQLLEGAVNKPRERERWLEFHAVYRAHVDATLPPAVEPQDA
jgi:hypothetical protein